MIKVTRTGTTAQKKSISVMAFDSEIEDTSEGTYKYFIGTIPSYSILIDAMVVTSLAAKPILVDYTYSIAVGSSSIANDIMNPVNIKNVGVWGALNNKVYTDLGLPIYITITIAGRVEKAAKFNLVLVYLEYTKSTSEYTNYD